MTESGSLGADRSFLESINNTVDSILPLCMEDTALFNVAMTFQFEQASSKAKYDLSSGTADKLAHMKGVLDRMADLAMSVSAVVLARTTTHCAAEDASEAVSDGPCMRPASSVDDLAEGTDAWLETGAHLIRASIELLSLVLLVHAKLRPALQTYIQGKGIVSYLDSALSVPREQEIKCFQEGFKTEHVRLIANLAFENPSVAAEIVKCDGLLLKILNCTRIDEENPGMVEWAEFAIRNLCAACPDAQQMIKELSALDVSPESKKLLDGKVQYSVDPSGKVVFSNVTQ